MEINGIIIGGFSTPVNAKDDSRALRILPVGSFPMPDFRVCEPNSERPYFTEEKNASRTLQKSLRSRPCVLSFGSCGFSHPFSSCTAPVLRLWNTETASLNLRRLDWGENFGCCNGRGKPLPYIVEQPSSNPVGEGLTEEAALPPCPPVRPPSEMYPPMPKRSHPMVSL